MNSKNPSLVKKIMAIYFLKFMFSKKATKIDKILTVDLTATTYCKIDGEDFVNLCGLLRKRELYQIPLYYESKHACL